MFCFVDEHDDCKFATITKESHAGPLEKIRALGQRYTSGPLCKVITTADSGVAKGDTGAMPAPPL